MAKKKLVFDRRKGLCIVKGMKVKTITFKQVLASVRKEAVRPSVVILPKTVKVKNDRNSWKRDQE
jgi:hypothetical protein